MGEFAPHFGSCHKTAKSHPYFLGYLQNWMGFFGGGRAQPRSAAPMQMAGHGQAGPVLPK